MNTKKLQKGLVLLTITAGVFAAGCELIVDFDRTRIPIEGGDASPRPDASLGDSGTPELDAGSEDDAGDVSNEDDGDASSDDAGDASNDQ